MKKAFVLAAIILFVASSLKAQDLKAKDVPAAVKESLNEKISRSCKG